MNIISSAAKTAVLKSNQGWFDRDDPTVFHTTRSQARLVRRSRVSGTMTSTSTPTPKRQVSTLQERAVARLRSMGVEDTYIDKVVSSFGYNASVSYGHMMTAGATHDEALEVISFGFPDVSLSYGQKRQRGMNHLDALHVALDV